ncbi:uncharacterized protein LOC124438813 isoform X2 [Xenia sp. Carnegie-2017]|uniref:uncharacterized protein LOC124438813 isoform X2 n=1 Tax=Xenia sp. Carnegie-2017 TaxID=2897299 RepID=UPI001F036615|nr:uncharacterized protein LOC124438813 isoform X2 [Xenia sp. Carnegie-2017]
MNATKTGLMNATKTGSMNATKTGSMNATKTGSMNATKIGSINATKTRLMNATKTGSMNATKTGLMNATKTGLMNATKTGSMNATKTGSMNATKTRSRNATKIGSMNATKTRSMNATKTGLRNATKTGSMNATKTRLMNAIMKSLVNANVDRTTVDREDPGPSSILYPVCNQYLGISNMRLIKDDQMTSDLMKYIEPTLDSLERVHNKTSTLSSSFNFTIKGNKTAPSDGRLGNNEGSWCTNPLKVERLVVDLGNIYILEGVLTQGRSDSDNWVTAYNISYGVDEHPRYWDHIKEVFKGNKDRNSIAVASFPTRIVARYLILTPRSYHGELMCMRVEAIGCHPDAVNVAKTNPFISQISMVAQNCHQN